MEVTLEDIYRLAARLPEGAYNEIFSRMQEIIDMQPADQKNTPVPCIYCGSTHVVRNGTHRGRQAYICRDCGKTFLETASSGIAYSHAGEAGWKQVIRDTLDGVAVYTTAKKLGLSANAIFNMRHKILCCVENAVSDRPGAPGAGAGPSTDGGTGEESVPGGQRGAAPGEGEDARPGSADGKDGSHDILHERIPGAHNISGKYLQRYKTFFEAFQGDPDEAVDEIYALMTERNHSYKTKNEIFGKSMGGNFAPERETHGAAPSAIFL